MGLLSHNHDLIRCRYRVAIRRWGQLSFKSHVVLVLLSFSEHTAFVMSFPILSSVSNSLRREFNIHIRSALWKDDHIFCQHKLKKSLPHTFSIAAMGTVSPPPVNLLKSMNFPQKTLMGPGPSNCPPRVLNACALPLLGHLHPEFTQIMDEVKAGIQYAFQTQNEWTVCISGTGHAAMEAACINILERGETIMVGVNGLWGERFSDIADRNGIKVEKITKPMGTVFTAEEIEEGLKKHSPVAVFLTQGESSGSTSQPLEHMGKLCHKYNCLLIVDSVAAMGGVPLFMDDWEIDVVYTGAQKVLSAPPGVSPISFSQRAKDKVKNRKTRIPSFYFDMNELANYWGCDDSPRRYHHTGPISGVYAIREGLARLAEVGLEASWAQHKKCAGLLHDGLEKLGLQLLVKDKAIRLPCVNGVLVPSDIHWKDVSDYAMKNYRVEISGGLGSLAGKIWRIGVMGYNATPENIQLVVKAIEEGLKHCRDKSN